MLDFVPALPKAELHVHLVGSASADTVLELARRHPDVGVPTEPDALSSFYEFSDFAHFIEVYLQVNRLVTTGGDVTALVDGLAADLARNGVRYAEVTVTPSAHLLLGIAPEELAEALTTGRTLARDRHGVEVAWVFDIAGSLGYRQGIATAEWVLAHRPAGTVAFGLGGNEVGVPRAKYRDPFDMARDGGLHLVPHAGETTGPETIWSALRDLHAERIGHGTSAVATRISWRTSRARASRSRSARARTSAPERSGRSPSIHYPGCSTPVCRSRWPPTTRACSTPTSTPSTCCATSTSASAGPSWRTWHGPVYVRRSARRS